MTADNAAPEIDALIRDALADFADDIYANDFRWKEHDCVNRFVHRHLSARVKVGSVLHDLAQIRIEGAVPHPPGSELGRVYERIL